MKTVWRGVRDGAEAATFGLQVGPEQKQVGWLFAFSAADASNAGYYY